MIIEIIIRRDDGTVLHQQQMNALSSLTWHAGTLSNDWIIDEDRLLALTGYYYAPEVACVKCGVEGPGKHAYHEQMIRWASLGKT